MRKRKILKRLVGDGIIFIVGGKDKKNKREKESVGWREKCCGKEECLGEKRLKYPLLDLNKRQLSIPVSVRDEPHITFPT